MKKQIKANLLNEIMKKTSVKELILKVEKNKNHTQYFYEKIIEKTKENYKILDWGELKYYAKEFSKKLNKEFKMFLERYLNNDFYKQNCDEVDKDAIFDKSKAKNIFNRLDTCNEIDVYKAVISSQYGHGTSLLDYFFDFHFNLTHFFFKLKNEAVII